MIVGPALDVPVDPDAPHARRWLMNELSKPEYQAARPTWFDRAVAAVQDWFTSLQPHGTSGGGFLAVIVIAAAAAVIVAAFFVFGMPRLTRRRRTAPVFDTTDERSSARLRDGAEAAAADGRWVEAVCDMFRCIARTLAERGVVPVAPGTTATEVAHSAGGSLPALASELAAAARVFDDARYLDRGATADDYARLSELERRLGGRTRTGDRVGRPSEQAVS